MRNGEGYKIINQIRPIQFPGSLIRQLSEKVTLHVIHKSITDSPLDTHNLKKISKRNSKKLQHKTFRNMCDNDNVFDYLFEQTEKNLVYFFRGRKLFF